MDDEDDFCVYLEEYTLSEEELWEEMMLAAPMEMEDEDNLYE